MSELFDGGNGGSVELLDNVLVIRRKGVASFLTQGLKGEKRIPFSSITSVQFKEAGFTTGYIQFGVSGGIESRGGVWNATTDENTVLFTKEASAAFHKLRALVEERLGGASSRESSGLSIPATPNVAEELTRLADLRDRGVLTDGEFALQKARLLGNDGRQEAATTISAAAPDRASPQTIRALANSSASETPNVRKGKLGRAAGIGCLGILGIFVLLAFIGSKIDPAASASNATQPGATPDSQPAAELPLAVSAKELWGAFQGNEASAQSYFGKRQLYVTGTVDRVQLDFLDHPEVLLRTPNDFQSVQVQLAEDARGQANDFSPGDKAHFLCEDVSEVAATPMLQDCRVAPAGVKTQPINWAKK